MLLGFGSFGASERAVKKGFNPKTKQQIDIAALKAVKFKVGAVLRKRLINRKPKILDFHSKLSTFNNYFSQRLDFHTR